MSIFKPVRFLASTLASTALSTVGVFATLEIDHQAQAIVTTREPNEAKVEPGEFSGVASLQLAKPVGEEISYSICTGSLLSSGRHILTAAHCFTDAEAGLSSNVILGGIVTFPLETGGFLQLPSEFPTDSPPIGFENIFIHPDWDPTSVSNDLAIVELTEEVPEGEIERYGIYRDSDEIGQVFTKVGYGRSGQGSALNPSDPFVNRAGQNRYESTATIFGDATLGDPLATTDRVLIYDFDSGEPENDLLGLFGIPDLGLGLDEANGGPGDSGSPSFINGLISGITSGGTCLSAPNADSESPCVTPPDVDNDENASFGEFGFETRISAYAGYIDDVLAGNIAPTATLASEPSQTVPEPNTIVGVVFALGAFAAHSRSKKAK